MLSRLAALHPVEGVVAVHAPGALPVGTHGAVPETVAGAAPGFAQAGWRFLPAGGRAEDPHAVFRDGDGQVKIDAGALNLRFDPSADEAGIARILQHHGLHIRRPLGFAPNLFLVTPEGPGADSVSRARALYAEDLVLYAEPVLIEPMARR
ncbi:hypothetical protein [Paracoccus yeei]|uniref:hypothetical protein n=1 Tax=Paracoccus yeei TaxID=147645 RepID=UPI003BF8BE0E